LILRLTRHAPISFCLTMRNKIYEEALTQRLLTGGLCFAAGWAFCLGTFLFFKMMLEREQAQQQRGRTLFLSPRQSVALHNHLRQRLMFSLIFAVLSSLMLCFLLVFLEVPYGWTNQPYWEFVARKCTSLFEGWFQLESAGGRPSPIGKLLYSEVETLSAFSEYNMKFNNKWEELFKVNMESQWTVVEGSKKPPLVTDQPASCTWDSISRHLGYSLVGALVIFVVLFKTR